MLLARPKLWLFLAFALATFAGVGSALAQDWTPFGPSNIRYDLELFKAPDLSTYADLPRPQEGMFFQYERLYWAIQQPTRTDLGVDGASKLGYFRGPPQFDPTVQPISDVLTAYGNSVDTGFLRGTQTWGNRFELGYIDENCKGWLLSVLNLQDQINDYVNLAPSQTMVFRDPRGLSLGFVDGNGDGIDDDLNINGIPTVNNAVLGVFGRPLPNNLAPPGSLTPTSYAGFTDFGDEVPFVPIFDQVAAEQHTSINSVEVSRMWRYPPTHSGNQWELLFGVRWLIYRDSFDVTAIAPTTFTALPGVSFWDTAVDNNLFGPQIGARFDHVAARFDLSAEVRFLAAVNFQSVHQNGELASALDPTAVNPTNVPLQMVRTSFHNWEYDETFAPVGEIRTTVAYKLTQAISVQAGYNAMVGGGISRASRRIDYVLPAIQILDAHKNDAWFTDGLSIGLNINR